MVAHWLDLAIIWKAPSGSSIEVLCCFVTSIRGVLLHAFDVNFLYSCIQFKGFLHQFKLIQEPIVAV